MNRLLAGGKYVARDAGGTWPTPMDGIGNEDSIEWILRYGSTERLTKARFLAASIVSAYRELISLPRAQRDPIIRDLRDAIRTARETGAEHE
jgi:hypothetical protein